QPCAARDLGSPLRKTVDSCVTRRNLPYFNVGVVGEGSDETGSSCQRALGIDIGECLLCPLAFRDVAGHAEQSHRIAPGIADNRAVDSDPAGLAGVRVVWRRQNPILSVPPSTAAFCLCQRSVYTNSVVGMNETPRLFDRYGRRVVSMNLCRTCIALEA